MYGRKEASAISLVLLMILSTQIAIIAKWDYESKELPDDSQRFDTNNAGVNLISLGDDSACAIGTNQKMKCWGDSETRFLQVSSRTELYSRGNVQSSQNFQIFRLSFRYFFTHRLAGS